MHAICDHVIFCTVPVYIHIGWWLLLLLISVYWYLYISMHRLSPSSADESDQTSSTPLSNTTSLTSGAFLTPPDTPTTKRDMTLAPQPNTAVPHLKLFANASRWLQQPQQPQQQQSTTSAVDSNSSPHVRVYPEEWLQPVSLGDLLYSPNCRDISLEYRVLHVLTETSDMAKRMYRNRFANDASLLSIAKARDRYRDMQPFFDNVVMDPQRGYINASYVPDSRGNKQAFIATQGPLESTVSDFWTMVYRHKVSIILALCQLQEGTTQKCFQYWPSDALQALRIKPTNPDDPEIVITPIKRSRRLLLSHNNNTNRDFDKILIKRRYG